MKLSKEKAGSIVTVREEAADIVETMSVLQLVTG